ncbi:MAG: glycosyltransferase family A protein, partial [Nanoarchaeota archaeon]
MNLSNVLVGCPTYDGMEYCRESYVKHVKHLTYKKYDVVLVDNSKKDIYQKKLEKGGIKVLKDTWQEEPLERVVSSRNILRQYAVDKEYDYLL